MKALFTRVLEGVHSEVQIRGPVQCWPIGPGFRRFLQPDSTRRGHFRITSTRWSMLGFGS